MARILTKSSPFVESPRNTRGRAIVFLSEWTCRTTLGCRYSTSDALDRLDPHRARGSMNNAGEVDIVPISRFRLIVERVPAVP